jgi:hypothetical protein
MLRKLVISLINLLFINIVFADSYSNKEQTTNFVIAPSIAYRYDVFKWAIPHREFTNKKNSELIWKNHIVQPGIKFEIEPKQNQFTFLGQVKYGYILKNQSNSWDHDWDNTRDITGNVISKLVSTTKSQTTGNILDLSGAVGYSLNLFKNNLFSFYLGYDYSDYQNKNYGDIQLAYKTNFSFSSGGLSRKYYFKTHSPWLGLSINTPITVCMVIKPLKIVYKYLQIQGLFHYDRVFLP